MWQAWLVARFSMLLFCHVRFPLACLLACLLVFLITCVFALLVYFFLLLSLSLFCICYLTCAGWLVQVLVARMGHLAATGWVLHQTQQPDPLALTGQQHSQSMLCDLHESSPVVLSCVTLSCRPSPVEVRGPKKRLEDAVGWFKGLAILN